MYKLAGKAVAAGLALAKRLGAENIGPHRD